MDLNILQTLDDRQELIKDRAHFSAVQLHVGDASHNCIVIQRISDRNRDLIQLLALGLVSLGCFCFGRNFLLCLINIISKLLDNSLGIFALLNAGHNIIIIHWTIPFLSLFYIYYIKKFLKMQIDFIKKICYNKWGYFFKDDNIWVRKILGGGYES